MEKHCVINEQRYMQKNNGKLEKWNLSKTRKQWKRLFRMFIKTKLYGEKIFVNNLGATCQRKVNDLSDLVIYQTLMLIKPAYVGMCILKLNKVFMHEFYYDYVKNKNDSSLLFTGTNSLIYDMKNNWRCTWRF